MLRKAVAKVEALPPAQQDFYAHVLLENLKSERRWDESFSQPIEGTRLEHLIVEAEDDIRDGRTTPLEELVIERGHDRTRGADEPREQGR